MYMFLFWVFLVGILIATSQDLKRREVDNWLNFLILVFGIVFILFMAIGFCDYDLLLQGMGMLLLGFVFMNLFYYGRVFAGGDAKLLFALSIFFIGGSFFESFLNFFVFIFFLFFCGGIYGMCYSFVLYGAHFRKSNIAIKKYLIKYKFLWFFIVGIVFLFFGILNNLLFIFGFFIIFAHLLFSFAKGLEEVVMIRDIKGSDLREGDLLVNDVRVGKRVINASFDGVDNEEIELLRKKKKVKIRDGIPFVPAFLFAFILYYFYSGWFGFLLQKIFGW